MTPPSTPAPSGMPAANRATTQLDTVAWKSQKILLVVLVIGLVVIGAIAAFSLHQNSVLQAQRSTLPPAPSLIGAAPPNLSGPSVIAGAKTPLPNGSPVVGAQPKQGITVPPEVLDYLDFLGKVEAQRITLKNNVNGALAMLGAAKGMQGATEPEEQQGAKSQINSGYTDYTAQWQQLIEQFQSKQPPAECEELANDYYRLLTDYANFISQIQVAMQNNDLSKVMSLQGAPETQINTDATTADTALANICQKYGIQKPFNIPPDSGGSGTSLLGP